MHRLRSVVHDVHLGRAEPLAEPALDAGVAVDGYGIGNFVRHNPPLNMKHPLETYARKAGAPLTRQEPGSNHRLKELL